MTPSQLGAAFFIAFAIGTLWVFAHSARPWVRRLYLTGFFIALVLPGFAGKHYWLWPFQTWHLWGGLQPRQGEFQQLLLRDETGHLTLYDRRAIPPLLDTQVYLLARQLIAAPPEARTTELSSLLLDRANALRANLLAGTSDHHFLDYPERQYGRTWSHSELASSRPFVQIVARRVRFRFDATLLEATTELVEERSFR